MPDRSTESESGNVNIDNMYVCMYVCNELHTYIFAAGHRVRDENLRARQGDGRLHSCEGSIVLASLSIDMVRAYQCMYVCMYV